MPPCARQEGSVNRNCQLLSRSISLFQPLHWQFFCAVSEMTSRKKRISSFHSGFLPHGFFSGWNDAQRRQLSFCIDFGLQFIQDRKGAAERWSKRRWKQSRRLGSPAFWPTSHSVLSLLSWMWHDAKVNWERLLMLVRWLRLILRFNKLYNKKCIDY